MKVFGTGISHALSQALFTIIIILLLKVILTKNYVKGLSEGIQAV
jgi:hypothetical protein